MKFLEDDNMQGSDEPRQNVDDTVSGVASGVADGDLGQVGDELKRDAEQTKDDAEDVIRGEDGNNS